MPDVKVDEANPLKLMAFGDPKVHFAKDVIGLSFETMLAETQTPLPIQLVLEKDGAALLLQLLKAAQDQGILPHTTRKVRSNFRQ
jgi:hypothetical protein